MSEPTLDAQTREVISIWEDALCLRPLHTLLPADLARARNRLARLYAEAGARQYADLLLFFYRTCIIISRHHGSATMGEFSDASGVPLSTATRIVDRLEEGGYVKRVTDPEDRRIVRIVLTDEGKKLYKVIADFTRQRIQVALDCFTSQERKNLIVLMRKAVTILSQMTG